MKIKMKVSLLVAALLIITGGSGLAYYVNTQGSEMNKVTNLIQSYDFPVANGLEEMANAADVIVVGEYIGFDSTWNMARNPGNPLEEDPKDYVEGRLYNFQVDKILKGNGLDDNIKVNHRYAENLTIVDSDAQVNSEGIVTKEATESKEINFKKFDSLFIEPENGSKYILFLKENKELNNYYGAIEPFSIKFDTNDVAALQSNLIDLKTKEFTSEIEVEKGRFVNITEPIDSTIKDTISKESYNDLVKEIEDIVLK